MAGTVICDYINSANVSGGFLGIGQTWQNVTASRAAGVTYTNSTGKPIEISVATLSSYTLYLNGMMADSYYGTSSFRATYSFIIPNGHTYRLEGSTSTWVELR